jgi:hypothetical protein
MVPSRPPSVGSWDSWDGDARPDVQGGLVKYNRDNIVRLDPQTGQPTTLDSNPNAETPTTNWPTRRSIPTAW